VVDYAEIERQKEKRKAGENRERRIQKTTLKLQDRFGKM